MILYPMNLVSFAVTIARVKNQLNNADSVLEAARMENKNLSETLMTITKGSAKLQNKLQSQLQNRRLDALKVNEYITQNQKLKEEIAMVRENLGNINNSHSEKCKEVETIMEQNKSLRFTIDDLQKKVSLLEQERGSYKKTANEMRKAQSTFLSCYGNDAKFQKQSEEIQRTMRDGNNNLSQLKSELAEVSFL